MALWVDWFSRWLTHWVPICILNCHYACEVCGDGGQSGNYCPETREELSFVNNYNN
jgi:hypothetical protein